MSKLILSPSLNWEVQEKPVYCQNRLVVGYKAIVRSDTGVILNVPKKSYSPTRNERLMEVVNRLAEVTGFTLEGYDEYQGGRKVLAFLRNPGKVQVADFEFDDFMMIGNSHDYSTGFFVGTSTMMIRCENRFSQKNQKMKVFHTRNHDVRIKELISYFENYRHHRDGLFHTMEEMARVKVDEVVIDGLVRRLVALEHEEKMVEGVREISTRKANIKALIESSIDRECADIGYNALGLFNGVTHYTTHVKKTRERVFGNVLGGLNLDNQKAFAYCAGLI